MLANEIKQFRSAPTKDLRKFGWVVGGVFLALGLWFFFRHKGYPRLFTGVGLPLVLLGTVAPNVLRPIYVLWMGLAVVMGHIVSTILLTLLFYLVVFPVGVAARLAGKDFLHMKLAPEAKSYWIEKEKTKGNYEQQF
jgi:hypothetical protein